VTDAVVLAALLVGSPLWGPGTLPEPSKELKHSDALMLLFQNLDDRIRSTSCDSSDDDGQSFKGKTVGYLLASRLGANTPVGTERKFAMECWDAQVPIKPGSKRIVVGWACTLYIERSSTTRDIGGGVFTFYVTKDTKRYLRNQVGCGP